MKPDLSKILEYFNNLNEQARYCVLAGVVFLIILLDVFFLVLPQMGGIADINGQIRKLSEDTQQVLADKQRLDLLRKNLQKERMQLRSLSGKVRLFQEVPAILSTISSTAKEYGVKIDELVPDYTKKEVLTTAPDGKYYALPVMLKARCGYHMFGRFFNKLENEDLYFILKDFIIQNDEKASNKHLFYLTVKIVLVDRSLAQFKNL
ncbi:MAG: type 4a pilus biogenesis protein PilO [Candidatus Omnitrophica bacterium]|nr:type 4a pilus biogenesis protein PilO [Candidatus Omnitrophota bacterium]